MATALDDYSRVALRPTGSRMSHLIWKDFQMLKPLAIAAAIGILALYGLAVLRSSVDPVADPDLITLSVLWVLVPNLVALGVPPMSLGTENEERTLDWLRTLPVKWWQVLLSKMLVGFAAWFFALLLATACFVLSYVVLRGGWSWQRVSTINGMESLIELLAYSVGLLLCGWVAALLVRNPIGSVLLVLPFILGVTLLWNALVAELIDTPFRNGSTFLEADASQRALLLGLAVVFTGVLSAAVVGLARRRLAGTSDAKWQAPIIAQAYQPTVVQVAWHGKPSRMRALLWQQLRQTRMVLGAALILLLGTILLSIADPRSNFMEPLFALAWPMMLLVLGVATFHGDRRGCRQGFFADRGWPATLIWLTRLIPTGSMALVLALALPFVSSSRWHFGPPHFQAYGTQAFVWAILVQCMLFVLGVLTGQWGRRPSLAFFGAPVVALLWMLPAFGLFGLYQGYVSLLWIAAAILLFATWRLTPFVMQGASSVAVWGRGLAYCLLALGVMCGCIFWHRWWTTPAEMPRWRNEMLGYQIEPISFDDYQSAYMTLPGTRNVRLQCDVYPLEQMDAPLKKNMLSSEFPRVGPTEASAIKYTVRLQPNQYWANRVINYGYESSAERFRKLDTQLDAELSADKSMGEHVSQAELYGLCVDTPISVKHGRPQAYVNGRYYGVVPYGLLNWRPLRRKALEVAAKWTRITREQSMEFAVLEELLGNAESNEWIVIAGLRQVAYEQNLFSDSASPFGEEDFLDQQVFVHVVDELCDEQLRREGRERSLVSAWQRFQNAEWAGWSTRQLGNEKYFLSADLDDPLYRMGIERKRFTRKLDVAVRETLDQLRSGLRRWDDRELVALRGIWGELLRNRKDAASIFAGNEYASPPRAPIFYQEQELLIDELRQMADELRE
ncbi:ABC transporter permease [Rhodopirellula halodulae]|uniref:ABC transporter permease n=1 Tax=Rhodopirellula halodulae TaxID=2894198 RepID=UPI001E4CE89D|nr:ABC transporter permease [Rhodopirellula sp. JC737]MCC9657288.1 ABC transporter permease [Rhodopirellula sp. JC737]